MNRNSKHAQYPMEETEYITDLAPILLAEDNLHDLELVQQALKKAGFINPIGVAQDGVQTIEFLQEIRSAGNEGIPLLMFLDLNLPRLSGLEVLKWIRRQEEFKHMPIIILSQSEHEPDILEAFRLGAHAYWVKPAQAGNLVQMLQGLRRKIGQAEREIAEKIA